MAALPVEAIDTLIATGASARMDADVAAGFRPGDRVRVRNINPATHTRLPRYTMSTREPEKLKR